ncbi:MAG: peptide chain release factor N(5)-glutamine methyltransferase [Parcubacteria group bacterium]
MATIQTIFDEYRSKIDSLDLELLIAHELKQSREFVLTYPEKTVTSKQETAISKLLARRLRHEPIAYILGHKEFYGLDFKVTKDTLIPRPETELLVEKALQEISNAKNAPLNIIDVGTGSGNIIISVAKNLKNKQINYFGIDISEKALAIAKYNAKKNNLTKIKFIESNLLDCFLKNNETIKQFNNLIILANLPYLSKEIYSATEANVKNFEPKSALFSPKAGLAHYEKLLKQIRLLAIHCSLFTVHCLLEISPEQKKSLGILIKEILPSAKIKFEKDLAGKWRVCLISLD